MARVGFVILLLTGVTGAASDFLTEGVDNARTGWVRDEKVFTKANVGSMKLLVEGQAREHAARDAQPVCAARGRARHDAARLARARGRRRRLRRSLWHRRRRRQADLAPALRQHAGQSRRHERYALSRRPDRRADDGADVARHIHDLRGLVGRAAAPGESRGRQGRRAAREIHPRRWQALRAQPAQRRHLHGDGAGLRRIDERVLFVRPRHTPRQRVHPRGWRPVGPSRRGHRSRGPGVSRHRRRGIRSADPSPRQRHRRREARRQQAAAAHRLLRRAECELALAARPRRQHDAGGASTTADGSSWSGPARSAGCGCWIATVSAARIIGRRCIRRRSSATTPRRSTPRASGAR